MVPILATCCLFLGIAVSFLAWKIAVLRRTRLDETEAAHRQLEEARRSLESERDAMLNTLNDSFLLIDDEGVIRFANVQAHELFQDRPMIDRGFEEIFLDDRLASPVREAIDQGKRVSSKVLLPQQASPLGPDDQRGETSWIVDAGPMKTERSRPLTRVIIRDTTTEHQTEQVRKDFVANASHELRTPLAIINGYLENLIEDNLVEDREATCRFLKIMRKHSERIARIVEDMLVISRLESGEAGNLKMKPFHVASCVQDVLERLESVISSQGARVDLQIKEEDLTIVGDRFYWTQVLFNLVENALKQNPNIPLKVSVGCECTPDGGCRIWVADNGVGIPSGDLPFIFRRFYRVEKHHSQGEIKGTGLGLSIVKRAVEAHGGTIEVSSTPGQETRFDISLPADRVTSASKA